MEIKETDQIIMVDIESLKVNPKNFFRKIEGEDFEEFKKSIEAVGLLQPIIIDKNNMIIGGEIRYLALKEMGYKKVPAIVKEVEDEDQKEIMMIHENVRRRQLSVCELRKALEREKLILGSVSESSNALGITRTKAYRLDAVNRLIPELKELFDKEILPLGNYVFPISNLSKEEQQELFGMLKEIGNASIRKEVAAEYGKKITDLKLQIEEKKKREEELMEKLDETEYILGVYKRKSEKLDTIAEKKEKLQEKVEKLEKELEIVKEEKRILTEKYEKEKKVIKVNFQKKLEHPELSVAVHAFEKYIKPLDFQKIPNEMLEEFEQDVWGWIKKLRKHLGYDSDLLHKNVAPKGGDA